MGRILIIDDSAFQRKVLRGWLLQGGHEVREAGDGHDGLKAIAESRPDCVLLDLAMPGLDGIGVLKALQDRGTDVRVVVVTADIQKDTKSECIRLGAEAVINKPAGPSELNCLIARVTSAKQGVGK